MEDLLIPYHVLPKPAQLFLERELKKFEIPLELEEKIVVLIVKLLLDCEFWDDDEHMSKKCKIEEGHN